MCIFIGLFQKLSFFFEWKKVIIFFFSIITYLKVKNTEPFFSSKKLRVEFFFEND